MPDYSYYGRLPDILLAEAFSPNPPVVPVTVPLSGSSLGKPGGIYLPERSVVGISPF